MKKLIVILGLLLATAFAASQFISRGPKSEVKTTFSAPPPAPEPLPAPVAPENFPMAGPSPALEAESTVPAVEEKAPDAIPARAAPARLPVTESQPMVPKEGEPSPGLSAAQSAPTEDFEPLTESPRGQPSVSDEVSAEPQGGEEPELIFRPYAGYGVKYVTLKQSGAFGEGDGGVDLASGPSVGVDLRYGHWSFTAAYEGTSVDFPVDSGPARAGQDFKALSLKGGYGLFYAGAKARTAPLVKASATSLVWAELTTIEALGGLRWEKMYAAGRRKPFLLGGELEVSIPVSGEASGGPSISSVSGFGLSLRGYAEKALVSGADYQLKVRLELSAKQEQTQAQGSWSGLMGAADRTIREFGTAVCLGLEF